MANTYTQIRIHIIFSTYQREPVIMEDHRQEVERYIAGTIGALNQKLLALYCMPEHIHILSGLNPDLSLSDFVQKIKTYSSRFINSKNWFPGKFRWQKGYGAFSYSKSQTAGVVDYILSQPEHHRTKSFTEEYLGFLEKFDVNFDPKYALD